MDRLAAALAGLLVVSVAAAVAPAGATATPHGAEANYTVVPIERQPGIGDADYKQFAISPIRIEYLDYIAATWYDGGFTGCGPANSEVFGIDRDDDESGTEVDEGLKKYVESSETGPDHFKADFYEKDSAVGDSTYIAEGDQFVSLTRDCFDNPDDPGWYQIQSTLAGTKPDGEHVVKRTTSHYFAVCNCDSREEAERKLGPPPSRTPTPTATPTPTPAPTPTRTPPESGTPFPSPTPTDSPTPTATQEPTPTPTTAPTAGDEGDDGGDGRDGAPDGSDGATATGTPLPTDWDEYIRETPTAGAGPGFASATAVLALAAVALLAARQS